MIFDHSTNRYAVSQRLPTDGAHAAEFFEIRSEVDEHEVEEQESSLWLAIANFGDRLGKRYESASTVWRLDHRHTNLFQRVASVPTVGATDWEFFQARGPHGSNHSFLAVSNEGDVQHGIGQTSHVYRIMAGDSSNGNTVDETRGDL